MATGRGVDAARPIWYNEPAEIGSLAGRFSFDNLVGVHGEPVSATALCSVGAYFCLSEAG